MFLMRMRNYSVFSIFFLSLFSFSHFTFAQEREPKFLFPVSCTYGKDCWPVNYVDVNPAADAVQDFKCKRKSYDGHKGTDFAIASIAKMRDGVDVLAAMEGKVLRVRDGENDYFKTKDDLKAISTQNKDCGNGVLIDHGDGLQTIYCHLKKDSVAVKPKQKVRAGQKIAQIGMSGRTEFPHVHFGVLWEGGVIDPFTGVLNTKGCGQFKRNMWLDGLPVGYEEAVIFDGGFRANVPDFEAVKRGEYENPETVSLSSASFVLWAGFYNVEEGDKVILSITDPSGALFHRQENIVQKTRTRQYFFAGRKIGKVKLQEGIYNGRIEIERNSDVSRVKDFSVRVAGAD